MVTKPKSEESVNKAEALKEVKKVVEEVKETKLDTIKKEIEDLAQSRGEVAKNIKVTDNYLITAKFFDADGREVRSYSRKLND